MPCNEADKVNTKEQAAVARGNISDLSTASEVILVCKMITRVIYFTPYVKCSFDVALNQNKSGDILDLCADPNQH